MRVTIIADDSTVSVEEQPLIVDLTGLDEDVHAVQWYGVRGEIEYKHDPLNDTKRSNFVIVDFTPYQVFVDRWMIEAQNDS